MKKTLTINLNNIVFNIDDDAFEMLQAYLTDVERHLSEDEKKEVMSDIEARVAELFTERLQAKKNVVTLQDVEAIIAVLGKPSEYSDAEETENNASSKAERKANRRYYRDPENAILGGVVGGIAAYLSWDVTLLRIIFVVLVFVGWGSFIPIYILVWLIAPAATTVSQRLEMQGENVTVDNIKTEISNLKNYVESDKFKESASTVGSRLGEVLKWTMKVLLGIIGVVFGFVGILILGALILSLLFVAFEPAFLSGFSPQLMTNWAALSPEKITLLIVSLLLVVGCPLFMIVFWVVRLILNKRDSTKTTSLVVLILWLAGIFMFYSVGANTIIQWSKSGNPWQFVFDQDNDDSQYIDQDFELGAFHGLDIFGNIDVILTQDSSTSIRVSAYESMMPEIVATVHNGVLKLHSKSYFINKRIKLYVTSDSITNIQASGACKVQNKSKMTSTNLSVDISGASKLLLDVDIKNKVDIELNGASYCDIDGLTNKLSVELTGASKIEADQLIAKIVDLKADGASNAWVYASESVDIKASGASKVKCEGNPKTVKKKSSGASKIQIP